MDERRAFIRHPVDVPIHIALQSNGVLGNIAMSDVGEGGVSFLTNIIFENGSTLRIKIAHVQPPFEALCVVCWQREKGASFEVGVRFVDEDSRFQARMVEQVCHIENYREKAKQEGRSLSLEDAANEWIIKFAADFGGR